MENMEKETHCTKMGADKSAENTPIAPKFICPNCLPKLKKKSIVRGHECYRLGVNQPEYIHCKCFDCKLHTFLM